MKLKSTASCLIGLSFWLLLGVQSSAQSFNSSLPIVVISTSEEIPDEPKILGNMGIIWKGDGEINSLEDPYDHYDGLVGIEIRGQSSQTFPKKSYGIELWDENQDGIDFALLGFPKEEDFVFHGPFSDKSLMRNALAYYLAGKSMAYAPRIKFFELIINDQYQGVYLLTEKIKRDKNRVDIKKLDEEDISGDKLTGGYIFKFDKGDPEEIAWESPYLPFNGANPTRIMYDTPDYDEMNPEQFEYIKGFVDEFEEVLAGDNFADPQNGYSKYIDEDTFIDYSLINEIGRNVDGYRLSTFFYKDRESIDGRLKAGPVWDFNLAFGNVNYCDGARTDGWGWDFNSVCPDDFWVIHFWWKRLLQDPKYLAKMTERWQELREGVFSDEKIIFAIDSMQQELAGASERNFDRWEVLDEYVWPNNFVGGTYPGEINYLKDWVLERLAWLDLQFNVVLSLEVEEESRFRLYPNPAEGGFFVESELPWIGDETLQIFNSMGQEVNQFILLPGQKKNYFELNTLPGLYFYSIENARGIPLKRGKILVK